ncbi:hypothetical protein [Bradyrhizobium ivorense]|uniref:hypothetical protein n=1 Tax=Bradyrhizobium ivorense TaxID=2511166 RepID=UPI0027E28B2E|nr:hypothetical protein [Bradyrhizobium ivorense]
MGECLADVDDSLNKDFNMRWSGSLVSETYRILTTGGTFLYPADARDGNRSGHLRLVYEAQPAALIVEQAGGMASTGGKRILDIAPEALHQRVPLTSSTEGVSRVEQLYASPEITRHSDAPLFAYRGLLRV